MEIRKSANPKMTIFVAVAGKMRVRLPTIPRRRKRGENTVHSGVVLQLTTFSVNFKWGGTACHIYVSVCLSVCSLRVVCLLCRWGGTTSSSSPGSAMR